MKSVFIRNGQPFSIPGMPSETYALVSATLVGMGLMFYTGYRTLFYSPEVHLYNHTRQDELQEAAHLEEKGYLYRKAGVFSKVGKLWGAGEVPTFFPDLEMCKPEDYPLPTETKKA